MMVRKSSAIFGAVVVVLLIVCVGLLITLLKNQPAKGAAHGDNAIPTAGTTGTSGSSGSTGTGPSNQTVATTTDPGGDISYRLPSDVLPLRYEVRLEPDLLTSYFTGTVKIAVEAKQQVNSFTVHVHPDILKVSKSSVTGEDDKPREVSNVEVHRKQDFYIMNLKEAVPAGKYYLHYEFGGNMSGANNVGFYRSTYKDKAGNERYLATSKFQPTYARRAFPCFDEPNFKSEFDVTLVHDPKMTALSNMDVVSTTPDPNKPELVNTKFSTSRKMVTYLACFIVCDFEHLPEISSTHTFKVYSAPDQVNKTSFALQMGVDILTFYEKYFDIKYPLPKLDMIAIPDFSSGAMEHWGLITYRETNLLYDAKESSPQNMQRVATVISHELAHMWFGNLVTMEWWDDLWLNEGFASYIEYKGVDEFRPDWNMLEQFLTEDLQPVMRLDATTSSHPIIQPVNNPNQITEIFDVISYNKGAAVLRMLESFVTEEKFQNGISNFLKKNEYGNAKTSELWEEINKVYLGEMSISEIMDTWTKQMGFPVVNVKRKSAKVFTVSQTRFLTNPKKSYTLNESPYGYVWKIPLSYITSKGKTKTEWLTDEKEKDITIEDDLTEDDWVKFNHNQKGYYLVNYESAEWERFSKLLITDHKKLSAGDRSSLLFDAFLLAQSKNIGYDIPLNMAKMLLNERDLTPWETAYSCLVQLGHLLPEAHFKGFLRDLTTPLYRELGWKTHTDHVDNLLQTTIVGLACYSGNEQCKQEAADKMKLMMDGKDPDVPLSLRNTLFHYAMEMGGSEKEWMFLWDKYETESSAQERLKLLYGMAHVKEPKLINRLLQYAMDPAKIKPQDFFTVLTYVAGNPVGRDIVWDFVRDKWTDLEKRFTIENRYLGRAVKSICDYFNTEKKLEEMLEFFKKYPDAGAGTLAREQALENVRNNIFWMDSHKDNVEHWLDEDGDVPFSNFRLSGDIVPEHYDLELKPLLEEGLFTGTVDITVKVMNRSRYLIVHAHQLEVTKTAVLRKEGEEFFNVPIRSTFHVSENQFWVTELERPAPMGSTLKLSFTFSGNLTGKLVGFYRSEYISPEGEKRYLATSQFQSTYARQAFPCFDEPQYKSTFTVSLVHSARHNAISNMPQEGSVIELDETWRKTSFQKSVKMVTYLVCVIVSDFEYSQDFTQNGKMVRVFARPAEKNRTTYALEIGIKTLEFFEKHFDIDYPLPKLDMIAVPDFQAGAMENWGLVTYRETLLLYDEMNTSTYARLRIDAVIGHELAHMWFGNLVTMKWWDDLWLNEGFASYMEYKSMDHINPTWEVDAQFFFEDTHRVLIPDASPSSHPIVQKVNHPDEISALFDAISYSKGAAVLRMLEFIMGSETFDRGITAYLTRYKFDNAVTADLWAYLKQAAQEVKLNLDVPKIMDSWTRQMGYPYINVTRTAGQGEFVTYLARPGRFLIDPRAQADTTSPYGYKWEIPLSYRTAENATSIIHWIPSNLTGSVLEVKTNSWTKFNSESKCYYLVNYGVEWINITNHLLADHKAMSPSDRANLISDVFLLARAGLAPYEYALRLTTYLKDERHFVPWETAKRSLQYLLRALQHDNDVSSMFKAYLDTTTKDALASLGWNDSLSEGHLDRRLRVTLVEMACDSGNKDCLSQAGKMLTDWKNNGTHIPSNLRLLVFRYGMQSIGDEEMWDFMWDKYLNETSSQIQRDYLHGLAFVNDTELINKFLNRSEDSNLIRGQDYYTALGYVAANPVGLPIVWNYVRNNWDGLVERFGLSDRYLGDMVKTVCSYFSTQEQLDQMTDFFHKYPDAGAGQRSRQEALQTVRNAIAWLEQHKASVLNWLEENPKKPWHNIRLTRAVEPIHYDLKLHPDIEKGNFEGTVSIQITLSQEQKYILVHSHLLNVTSASITKGFINDGPVELLGHFPHRQNQFWVLEPRESLVKGNYTVHMAFKGSLLGALVGFYRSSYIENGKTKYLATSQFQSTYARQAFPCFDEPSFKSEFTVTLVHEKHMTPLSNMPVQGTSTRTDGFVETNFQKSVKMVTYLVAVIVCDFKAQETSSGKTTIRVYAPPDNINQTTFSLEIGKEILEYFEKYFGILYPLPKLDMIALPDFRAGAMENWGLITYREVYLLYDRNETSPSVEFSIAMIIAHEIAHMWFGNLVTMEWWDDLWLNEGFATNMAYKCIDSIRPDMEAIGLLILGETSRVLEPDATWSSHPIVTEVNHPDEISAIFDAISYSKGASVLRKLENFLTPDVFQKGLQKYLEKNKFKNAKTEDLWDELTNEWKQQNVSTVMDTWTRQMGYPVVSISRSGADFEASQERFLLNRDDAHLSSEHPSPFNYTWIIPLHYKTEDSDSGTTWLNSEKETLKPSGTIDPGKIVKWNADQAGYYLVNYAEDDWKKWPTELDNPKKFLTLLDRSNLLSDAFLLAQAGYLKYELALDLTPYLKEKEGDFLPWNTGKSALLDILKLLQDNNDAVTKMKKYLEELSSVQFSSLDWNDSPDNQTYTERRLRVAIVDLACRAGKTECLVNAAKLLGGFLESNEKIPSAMRSLAYRYGVMQNNSLWEKLWEKYLVEQSAQERRDMLIGLAYTKDGEQLKKYLELAKIETNVRPQDYFYVLNNIAANPAGLDLAWDFYRAEWDFLVKKFTLNDGSLGGSFRSITSHFTTNGRLNEMKDFINKNPEAGAGKTDRKEALEIVETQIKWTGNYANQVHEWLNKKYP